MKKRKKDSHKGDYGHVFILAGSRGLTGAAALCANAVLRSGAGLATLGIPASLSLVMARKLTEVMTCALPETRYGTLSLKAKKEILHQANDADIVILGPGLSQNKDTQRLIREIVASIKKPLVLDADALNAICSDVSILKKIKKAYIVTPHPGEMSRLIGKSTRYIQKNRLTIAKKFSNQHNAVVVLKGSETIVAEKNKAYVNKTGNPGMATAGSGDVLTGVIGGFLAQGLEPFDAARLAVHVHGLAGDLAAKEKGEAGLIAGDILEKVPEAIESGTRDPIRKSKISYGAGKRQGTRKAV
ncbi:MAG: NAD(P)H-hydrate dehydratase [Candidatus Gorgyraea atricola]|nr:NAD(P)H-hydrate dehydratase [Candidatus Gorgyraea atricola]